jgi:hypothetical protein
VLLLSACGSNAEPKLVAVKAVHTRFDKAIFAAPTKVGRNPYFLRPKSADVPSPTR